MITNYTFTELLGIIVYFLLVFSFVHEFYRDRKKEKLEGAKIKNKSNKYIFNISITIVLGVYLFFIAPVRVDGDSMQPNLKTGDVVVVNRLDRTPERFDMIAFRHKNSNDFFIKRVIGLPGEKVEIRDGKVFINDKELEGLKENIIPKNENVLPKIVSDNSYYVLGDNRVVSYDSRYEGVGLVAKDSLRGVIFKVMKK